MFDYKENRALKKIANLQISGYQIDSRLIKDKNLFFALKGKKTDGHLYLEQICQKGALAAIIEKGFKIIQNLDIQLIRVKNVLDFMQNLTKKELEKSRAQKIGITGSFGKTTTKEFIFSLLEEQFKISKTYGNYNSQIGLPIAILNMDKNVDFLVLEMAMDKKGEIEKLVNIAPLDMAVLLQLTKYHENFKNINELAYAKKEIFSHKKTKIKLINKNLKSLKAFKNEEYLTFSIEDNKADFYLDIKNRYFYEMGKKIKIKLPFTEMHMLENLIAAIAVCRLLKESYENIFKKLPCIQSAEMRFEKIVINDILFIKDCYNASFDSTIASLKNLPKTKGKKIAILGSNPYLGKKIREAHMEILQVAKENVDEILCLGNEWKGFKNIKLFTDHNKLALHLKKIIKKNDVVLVKGSRIWQMEKILDLI